MDTEVGKQAMLFDYLPLIICISDLETDQVYFLNKYAQEVLGNEKDLLCHEIIYGAPSKCGLCRGSDLLDEEGRPAGKVISEIYNPRLERWFECHIQAIPWGKKLVRCEIAVDITEWVKLRDSWEPPQQFYSAVLKSIGDGVIITDLKGAITWMNPKAQELCGWSLSLAKGRPFEEVFRLVHAETRRPCVDPVAQVLKQGHVVGLANGTLLVAKSGAEYWIADSAAPIVDESNNVLGIIFVFHDITKDQEHRKELEHSEQRLRRLFQASLSGIALHEIVLDENKEAVDFRFLAVNEAFEKMTGYKNENLSQRLASELFKGREQKYLKKFGIAALTGMSMDFEDYNEETGKYFEIRVYSPHYGYFVTVFNDITPRKKMENRLKDLVFRDSLTGLYNRRYFENELERLSAIEDCHPLSVVIGDVNSLKIINDSLGHRQGDLILIAVGEALRKVARPEDVAARYGGDEFVLLLPNTSEAECRILCAALEEEIAKTEHSGPVPSIGLGCATKEYLREDVYEVLGQAENRMYRQKMSQAESSRNALVASLQKTLAEKSYETEEHARHLQDLALALAERVGLSDSEQSVLSLIALLHDVGKVAIPEQILEKPGPLTDEEWVIMKRHCEIGYRIVVSSPELMEVAEGILCHHERWDGTGYPRGLKGKNIPFLSRIIGIVDAYDAMVSARPYRFPKSAADALEEIKMCSGTQFDPELAAEFVKMMEEWEEED